MKTNYLHKIKSPVFLLSGIFLVILTSCGSYQKTTESRDEKSDNGSNSQALYYKNYFSSLKEENEEVITDIENYSSATNDSTEVAMRSNAAWGSSNENVTINVYDNSWGWNPWYGMGWYYPMYAGWGWSFGWGWNSWAWGGYYPYVGGYWPYYGGYAYHGHYGYNNHFYGNSHNNSPNRYFSNGSIDRGRSFVGSDRGRNTFVNGRNNSRGAAIRASNSGNTRPTTYSTRSTSRNTQYNPAIRNSGSTRNNQVAPSTSRNNNYTPSTRNSGVRSQPSSAPNRNYTPSGGGGSRPSGTGGGGRSSGGGGRRG